MGSFAGARSKTWAWGVFGSCQVISSLGAPYVKPTFHSRVIDLRRHAARTATAVERATAHVHSHVQGYRSVVSSHTTHAQAQARLVATAPSRERGVGVTHLHGGTPGLNQRDGAKFAFSFM